MRQGRQTSLLTLRPTHLIRNSHSISQSSPNRTILLFALSYIQYFACLCFYILGIKRRFQSSLSAKTKWLLVSVQRILSAVTCGKPKCKERTSQKLLFRRHDREARVLSCDLSGLFKLSAGNLIYSTSVSLLFLRCSLFAFSFLFSLEGVFMFILYLFPEVQCYCSILH